MPAFRRGACPGCYPLAGHHGQSRPGLTGPKSLLMAQWARVVRPLGGGAEPARPPAHPEPGHALASAFLASDRAFMISSAVRASQRPACPVHRPLSKAESPCTRALAEPPRRRCSTSRGKMAVDPNRWPRWAAADCGMGICVFTGHAGHAGHTGHAGLTGLTGLTGFT